MNPLLSEAANSVSGGWILGAMTILFFAAFIYWFWYAYAPSHKTHMEELGDMPFDSEADR
jgi:hypothetical protein